MASRSGMRAFDVQVVRMRRKKSGAAHKLQALKKVFHMRVQPTELKISSLPASASTTETDRPMTILRYFAPLRRQRQDRQEISELVWTNVDVSRIRAVKVKGRMLKVTLLTGESLLVRMRDDNDALEAAMTMMNVWGIEPLVETKRVDNDGAMPMEQLSQAYVANPFFRSLILQMHDHIESLESTSSLPDAFPIEI